MQLSTKSSTPGISGLPSPKKPKRNTQANIAMSITFFMPNLFIQNGMSSMQRVSEIWLMEIRALEFFTAKVFAKAGFSPKELRKVFA